MQRKVQVLGWTLIWSGVFIFGYLGWQLFGTDLVNAGVQADATDELEVTLVEVREELPEIEELLPADYLDEEEAALIAAEAVDLHPEQAPVLGEPFAFLRIPEAGVEEVLFEGVDRTTLKNGPGHMESTPLPGQPGNAVISGHRTTYGRPFFDLDMLEVGDLIEVETAIGIHSYEVRETLIVDPTDVWVTDSRPGAWITLTTCEPKFSARQRLIIVAEMVSGPNLEVAQLHALRFGS